MHSAFVLYWFLLKLKIKAKQNSEMIFFYYFFVSRLDKGRCLNTPVESGHMSSFGINKINDILRNCDQMRNLDLGRGNIVSDLRCFFFLGHCIPKPEPLSLLLGNHFSIIFCPRLSCIAASTTASLLTHNIQPHLSHICTQFI